MFIKYLNAVALFVAGCTSVSNAPPSTEHLFPLHISGPKQNNFNRIFEGHSAELISGDHTWTEGPVIFQDKLTGSDILMFSDVKENKMWIYEEGEGVPKVHTANSGGCRTPACFAKVEGGSNGLAYDGVNGHLLICQHGARSVSKLPINSTTGIPLQAPFQTVVDSLDGPMRGHFNSPNDIVIHPKHNGRIFFTDPPYGLGRDEERELAFNGVYHVVDYMKNPVAQIIDKSLTNPNGIAISPDGKNLFVAESFVAESTIKRTMMYHVYHIDVKDPQKVPTKLTSFNFTIEGDGFSDGIKIDPRTGLLVSSCPQGICIVGQSSPFGSKTESYQFLVHVKFLQIPEKVSNLAFGTNYLYLTGTRSIWRIKLRNA